MPVSITLLNWGWGLSCRQNTELAKLRQELSKVNKELVEKSEASRQEEQQRKALEAKAATFEKQVLQLQVSSMVATSVSICCPPNLIVQQEWWLVILRYPFPSTLTAKDVVSVGA